MALPMVFSVAMIVFGAFVAGARDLSFGVHSYSMVFIANMTTAIYLATINRTGISAHFQWFFLLSLCVGLVFTFQSPFSGKTSGLNSFGLMWCNGKITVPNNVENLEFHWNLSTICGIQTVKLTFRNSRWTNFVFLDIHSWWFGAHNELSLSSFSWFSGEFLSTQLAQYLFVLKISRLHFLCKYKELYKTEEATAETSKLINLSNMPQHETFSSFCFADCDAIFLHFGIFLELLHFLKYHIELGTNTDNVRQSEGWFFFFDRPPSFRPPPIFLMRVYVETISHIAPGSVCHWTWLVAIRWAALRQGN